MNLPTPHPFKTLKSFNINQAYRTSSQSTGGTKNLLTAHNHNLKIIDMKNDYTRTLPDSWKPMSRVFTALGDEHRQRILLLFEQGERLNAGQIAEVSTLSRSTVSHHLKILREAEVLASEKIGKEVWYWINCPYLEQALTNVLDYIRLIK